MTTATFPRPARTIRPASTPAGIGQAARNAARSCLALIRAARKAEDPHRAARRRYPSLEWGH
jgi:hypothetical protein